MRKLLSSIVRHGRVQKLPSLTQPAWCRVPRNSYNDLVREHAWSRATIDELRLDVEKKHRRRTEDSFLFREVRAMTY